MDRLHPDDLERLADLVADRLRGAGHGDRLLTVREAADLLACSADWLYENADRVGAIRLGDGPRAPLRFERARLLEGATPRPASRRSSVPKRQRRSQKAPERPAVTRSGRPMLAFPEDS